MVFSVIARIVTLCWAGAAASLFRPVWRLLKNETFCATLFLTVLLSCDDRPRRSSSYAGDQAGISDTALAIVSPGEAAASLYPYVWVTAQGDVHELDEWDRRHLETPFATTDPVRPVPKTSLESKDEWGGAAGFIARADLNIDTPINADPVKRIFSPFRAIGPEDEKYVAKRDVISRHETKAEFQGLSYHVCGSDVAGCPEFCSDSGEFATFRIVKYLGHQTTRGGSFTNEGVSAQGFRLSQEAGRPGVGSSHPITRKGRGDTAILAQRKSDYES